MTRILSYKAGDSTIKLINDVANYLMENKLADCCDEETGFQETSEALCDFEIHVVKKRQFGREY